MVALSIQKSLAVLVDAGVVEKSETAYCVGDPLFKRFVMQTVG